MAGVVSQMMHRGLGWGVFFDGGRWRRDVGRGIVRVVAVGTARVVGRGTPRVADVGTARPLAWSVDGEPNPRRDGWGEDGIDLSDGR